MDGTARGGTRRRIRRIGSTGAAALLAVLAGSMAGALPGLSQAGAVGGSGSATVLNKVGAVAHVPEGATDLGAMAATASVKGAVVLQPRDPAALTKFIANVTDKKSSSYHQYLAPRAYAAAFGPTAATVSAVKQQLEAGGLSVTNVSSDNLVVTFKGSASSVESTFHTGLDQYKLAGGSKGYATTGAIELPSSISSSVVSVIGLDDLVKEQSSAIVPPKSLRGSHPAASAPHFTHPVGSPNACTTATTSAAYYGGLTDDQIANAYGAFGLYSRGDLGATQTIAVYELGPFSRTNALEFDQCYFGPTKAAAMTARLGTQSTTTTLGVDGGQLTGATVESSLDVQDVSAIAPTAKIDVYQAPNNSFGGLDEYSAIVNQDKAKVVTSSWGLCEQAVQEGEPGVQQAENVIFEQAAAQGQSVFSAAGDTGSDDCNAYRSTTPVSPILSVDDPSSQPYVIAVGGTTITDATQPLTATGEHVWNDGAAWGAGGGGISQSWPMPSWQMGSSISGIHDTTAIVTEAETFEQSDLGTPTYRFCLSASNAPTQGMCRELPDVSAQADEFTGAVTMFTPTGTPTGWFTIGGTSSAAPIWAALLALVNTSNAGGGATCTGGTGVGFVSPLLYTVASTATAYTASFTDVTSGNNDPYGDSQLFPAHSGYDMASGLGSPKLTDTTAGTTQPGLAYYLCSQPHTRSARPTITTILPADVPTTAGGNVTVSGSGFCTGTTSLVTSVEVGTFRAHGTVTCTATPNAISVTLPPATQMVPPDDQTDGAGPYQVVVTLTTGQSSAPSATSVVEYVDETAGTTVPAVTGIRTYTGSETGTYTVEIYGTGFTGETKVTFGGVVAVVTSLKDYEITATVPAYTSGTTSCAQDGSAFQETATDDICQVAVVVTGPNGSSAPAAGTGITPTNACVAATGKAEVIRPFYEGLYATAVNVHGVIPATATYEQTPLPCEFDYVPAPQITSVSTTTRPAKLASEYGGSVVTIHGKGLNLVGFDWASIGTTTQATSVDYTILSVTGTEIKLVAPPRTNTTLPTVVTSTLEIHTVAGSTSNRVITYAGVPPTPTSVVVTSGPMKVKTFQTVPGAPDTGGTPIKIEGSGGYADAYLVEYVDAELPSLIGTQYNLTPGQTTIYTTTVPTNPGIVDVEVCTVTACSVPSSALTSTTIPATTTATAARLADVLFLFAPGNPVVTKVTPTAGVATGGTTVVITGQNLGCAVAVTFGSVTVTTVANATGFLDCGSTTTVDATVPPAPGAATFPLTVSVHVVTVESTAMTVTVTATPSVTYTYTHRRSSGGGTSGGGSGSTTAPPPPKAPAGSTTAKSGSSSTANGKATVTDAAAGVKATASGAGSLTVAKYTGNPTSTTLSIGTGKYVDVAVATGSKFTSLTVRVCGATASALEWWNGSVWLPFSDETPAATGCVTATVTGTTSPSLSQLTGTVVTAVKSGATATRIAGATADATAVEELETEFPATGKTRSCAGGQVDSANARSVVLATTKTFPDALSASYLASSLDTGVLLTPSTKLSSVTAQALKTEGVTKVLVVGGTLAVAKTVVNAISAMTASTCGGSSTIGQHITVTRIGGATALDTAAMIAKSVAKTTVGSASFTGAYSGAYNDTTGSASAAPATSSPLRTAVLADGNEYQDAMSASAMAYAMKFPVLLTSPTSLSAAAATAISALTITQVIVMGGPYALSNSVVSTLEGEGVSVLRVGGADATDTAAELAKFEVAGSGAGLGWTGKASAAVARVNGFTDGLAGSVVTGRTRLPLLLTENQTTLGTYLTAFLKAGGQSGPGIDGLSTSKLKGLAILGGALAITTAAVAQMLKDIT